MSPVIKWCFIIVAKDICSPLFLFSLSLSLCLLFLPRTPIANQSIASVSQHRVSEQLRATNSQYSSPEIRTFSSNIVQSCLNSARLDRTVDQICKSKFPLLIRSSKLDSRELKSTRVSNIFIKICISMRSNFPRKFHKHSLYTVIKPGERVKVQEILLSCEKYVRLVDEYFFYLFFYS